MLQFIKVIILTCHIQTFAGKSKLHSYVKNGLRKYGSFFWSLLSKFTNSFCFYANIFYTLIFKKLIIHYYMCLINRYICRTSTTCLEIMSSINDRFAMSWRIECKILGKIEDLRTNCFWILVCHLLSIRPLVKYKLFET